jgi:nucleotide-binding universal stress UspA family protein
MPFLDAHQHCPGRRVLMSTPTANGATAMSSYKTILVQLDLDEPAEPRLQFGRDLARRFDADLVAFTAAAAELIVPVGDNGMGAAEAMRLRAEDIENRLKASEAGVRRFAGDDRRVSWIGALADPSTSLAIHARAADLVVLGPGLRKASRTRGVSDPGSVILSAGRPVLLPAESLAPVRPDSVVVAWKDTREARRAVADAMPFLTAAKQVAVVTVEEETVRDATASAADVVRFLSRHGVSARPVVVEVGARQTVDALEEIAAEIGADLVVAGGYGHSRLREWAFGGVTRSLLGEGKVHRLFSN